VPLGTTALAALLLVPAKLAALPSVQTISGGPTAGYADGDTKQIALYNTPVGLALDSSGNFLYVADRGNNAIRELNLSGNLTFTFATYGINSPVGVALDKPGNVYVLNHGSGADGTVLEFDVFGNFMGTLATGLVNANGLVVDSQGNVYVTVNGNSVLQIAPNGTLNTIATISASSIQLQGITIMNNGFLAVADSAGNGIWLVDPSTSTNISQLTGFNGAGDHFGTKAFAKFNQPMGVTATGGGMVVVADYGNNRVKVVDSSGTVTNLYGVDYSFWVTGSGTFPGWFDGTVCAGDLNYNSFGCVESRLPAGVFFASDGSVYSTEDYYHLIRKVTGTGLPQPPPPPAPVPEPTIGWVDFTLPPLVVSVLRTDQPFIFNNDVKIEIIGTPGTETHFTFGPTPVGVDTIPNPSATVGGTPPPYHDGMFFEDVPDSILPVITNDVTFKVIGTAPERTSSQIVVARFQFKAANPVIAGNNAALFSVTEQTTNAVMWYTTDGSDPTPASPSIGPITSGQNISLNASANVTFKVRAFRSGYQDSDIVSTVFSTNAFVPNSMSFGFASGEASSDFVGAPGQTFYAPVTFNVVPGTKVFSMQFNLTVTNAGPNPGPAVTPGDFGFLSMLFKPDPANPGLLIRIPPAMSLDISDTNPPPTIPTNQVFDYNHGWFEDLTFANNSLNLLGVGWLERAGETNLYNTLSQDLIKLSQAHDTTFDESGGKVILGGYSFQIPATAVAGQTYQIAIGRPSATSDGIGMPGSEVFIATPTNGSLTAGPINSVKIVTAGQRKYVVGDCAPFRWFNAGDFGNTNLDNSDVEQVFQSAIYGVNYPPLGSDFFDSMDSCGTFFSAASPPGYLIPGNPVTDKNALFNGNDTTINQIAFGDGVLDVCDVYVTFRRSLDPSLTWFRRFWTNGVLGAEAVANQIPSPMLVKGGGPGGSNPTPAYSADGASVQFVSGNGRATAGQTITIPITANVFGSFPLRVAMLNLSVVPLDGSPGLTAPVQFTPNPALGQPTMTTATGNANYAATWLNSSIAGLSGSAVLGTLTVQVPANATQWSAYAVRFDHASASPNGIASFPKQTVTGLITLSDRSTSSFNDGIPDSWRLRYFGTVNNLLSQASADADGDGANNWQEYVAGTDPTDPKSCLRVSSIPGLTLPATDCGIHWPSVAGKQYVIERTVDLFAPNWIPVSTNIGSGTDMEFHDTTGGNVRFYRVRVGP
jgi:hypothetical protein